MKTRIIETIPHNEQRYDTAGDYEDIFDHLRFYISDMGNEDYEFILLLHELIEEHLTRRKGIKISDIDKWDMEEVFKKDPKYSGDPGLSKLAPYHKEHMIALRMEKLFCKTVGIDFNKYNKIYDKLKYK